MLNTITPDKVVAIIIMEYSFLEWLDMETISLDQAWGRILSQPVESREYIPGFDRSTVDRYVVQAADTFGCSDAIPASR